MPKPSSDYQSTMVGISKDNAPTESRMDDGTLIIRQPDGSIIIENSDIGPRIPKEGDFDENLAEYFTTGDRVAIADELVEFKRIDIESRKDWEDREQRALEMMGIRDIPPDRDDQPGLHRVTHPLIMEAVVQFQARAIAEFFPATGPVKGSVLGKRTKEFVDQAERVETFMNYYLTTIDRGYYDDSDQMLLYLPISGSAFRKGGQDWRTGLPQMRYVKATNFIAPYMGTTLDNMPRYCHSYTMTGQDIKQAMDIGMFMDVNLARPFMGQATHSKTADTADLRQVVMHEDDELYPILEYHIELPLKSKNLDESEDGVMLPYIVLVEETNREVLMIRRLWKEDDEQRRKKVAFAHYKFLPGLGFYGFGFPHVIGSLGRAASGAVNALLDTALMANMQGGFKTKDAKIAGEMRLSPGVWKDVDATYEEISKAFYTPPFHQPSPALFQLLESLVEAGRRFSSATEVMTGNADNRGPVGTTIALIEEGSRVYTAVHKRMHNSAKEEFRLLFDLIHDFMPNRYDYDTNADSRYILRQDFDGRVDIVPVSDPNIFSSTQRIALAQAVLELQAQAPDLYQPEQRVAAHRRLLEALRIPDVDEVAPHAQVPVNMDPISENAMMAAGKPVRVYETQLDPAHVAIHKQFLQTMIVRLADQPQQLGQLQAVMGAHLQNHAASMWRKEIAAAAGVQLPPLDVYSGIQKELPQDVETKLSSLVAAKLPPPPPPPQAQPSDAQVKANAIVLTTQAKQKALSIETQARIDRETQSFLAEQKQRQESHALQMHHLREEHEAGIQREDETVATKLIRDRAEHTLKLGNLRASHQVKTHLDVHGKIAKTRVDLHTAAARAKSIKKAKTNGHAKPA